MKIKKIMLGVLTIAAIVAVNMFNVNMSVKNDLSPLVLANIEALADPETEGYGCTVSMQCCG